MNAYSIFFFSLVTNEYTNSTGYEQKLWIKHTEALSGFPQGECRDDTTINVGLSRYLPTWLQNVLAKKRHP